MHVSFASLTSAFVALATLGATANARPADVLNARQASSASAASASSSATATSGGSASASASSAASTATGSSNATAPTTSGNATAAVPTAGPYGLDNVRCVNVTLTTPINSTSNVNFTNVDDNYSNGTYITQQVLEFSTDQANWTAQHVAPAKANYSASYQIAGELCSPVSNAKNDSSLIVGVHGIGFDRTYWNFNYSSNYSFVRHAASHGYSTFIFDRLGTGNSSAPGQSGFNEVQAPTELAILTNILQQLRNGTSVNNTSYGNITLIGHSYGSALSLAVASQTPELVDNLVLTGFSANSSYMNNFVQAATLTPIRNIADIENQQNKSAIYLGTASNVSDVELFLDPPNYEAGAAQLARRTAQPVTLGELASLSTIVTPAANYTGPVYVLDGARDLPFCGRQCDAPSGNYSDQAAAVQQLFPVTRNFTSFILPNTGHGITIHPTSSEGYERVLAQIIGNGF